MAGWIGFPSAGEGIVRLHMTRQNFHWPSACRFTIPRSPGRSFDAAAGLIQRARAVNHSLRDEFQDARILDYFGKLTKTAQHLISRHPYSAPSHSMRAISRMPCRALPPPTQPRRLAKARLQELRRGFPSARIRQILPDKRIPPRDPL